MPMTPCGGASRSLPGCTPQSVRRSYQEVLRGAPSRYDEPTSRPLSSAHFFRGKRAAFIRRPIDGPYVSVVSTLSGESRRKGDGRLSQREGILNLKFSYAVMFHRRAIDKTSNRAICSVRRLHLRACDESGVLATGSASTHSRIRPAN